MAQTEYCATSLNQVYINLYDNRLLARLSACGRRLLDRPMHFDLYVLTHIWIFLQSPRKKMRTEHTSALLSILTIVNANRVLSVALT